jgi:two-component system chemotaxis response regulator CheY
MVHRDIKPANLMRDLGGCIKVADLGLALVASDGDAMEATSVDGAGIIAGTIDYMAPEQGIDASMADGRADIYSLGCTLFYLLTGRVVFESRAPLKRLLAHRSNPPPKLHEVAPQADFQLDVIFQRAMAKEPDQRFTSMNELITALDQWEQRRQQPTAQAVSEWETTKVVIVEKSRLQAAMITKLLNDVGIREILVCASGSEALEALAIIPTGVVLISLQLPDMSGLLLTERIREGLRWSRVTAIIMTSDTVVPSFQEAVSHLGRVGLIQKPFDSATLADTIRKLQRAESEETLSFNGLAARRVLIVDDSNIARKSIQKTLTELGFINFTTADDGKPAVELMRQQDFDLVITDYTMPDMNGRDLVAWIRQQSRQKEIPIVMVTTEFEPAKLAEVYQLGVSAICGKSFDMDMVRNIIFRLFA